MALAITATPDPTTNPPSVRLTISGSTSPVTVVRQAADGSSATVRTSDGQPLPTGSTALVDYEAPFSRQLTYIANGTAISTPVVLPVSLPWLVHPGNPALSMPVEVTGVAARKLPAQQGVFPVIGRKNPIVVTSGRRSGAQSSLTVLTETLADAQRMELLLSDTSTLLLNTPTGVAWAIQSRYVAIGEVEVDTVGATGDCVWTLAFTAADAPIGGANPVAGGTGGSTGGGSGGTGSTPNRTWADLAAELQTALGHAPNWSDAAAKYPTWAAAAAGSS